ncbi:hypothetical protein [Paenibacillus chitinolyticus]|uniref:hypothetical protein n=1 Tax=Paenibacillus chitinolyticus TaxID=79263 RepID=UPI0036450CFC
MNSEIEYIYRVFKSTWGIYIKIVSDITQLSQSTEEECLVAISPGIWAKLSDAKNTGEDKLLEDEVTFLWEGLRMVAEQIKLHTPYKSDTLINITQVSIAPCDFQKEGLTAAIIEWAAVAFNFKPPTIMVEFIKDTNRYEFDYKF